MLKVERKKWVREGVRQVVMRERIPPVDPGVVLIAELYVIYHMAVGSDSASESLFAGQPVPKHIIEPLDHRISTHSPKYSETGSNSPSLSRPISHSAP